MRGSKTLLGVLLCGIGLSQSPTASAVDLMTFAYSNLNGGFNSSSLLFTAVDDPDSLGNVSRLVSPTGNAAFIGTGPDNGFPGAAAFAVAMEISNASSGSAQVLPGDGALALTDVNGDMFFAGVEGIWVNDNGAAKFIGSLTGVVPINTSADGTFDGTTGSNFSMNFPGTPPFSGNVLTLVSEAWFTDAASVAQDFGARTTLAIGTVVPEPATLALLAVSGLAVALRRRRSA